MMEIRFRKALTMREIVDPAQTALRDFSRERNLGMQEYVLRQEAYATSPRNPTRPRQRIGCHGHLEYSYGFGELGRIFLLSDLEFGGFVSSPVNTYEAARLAKPSELGGLGRIGLIDPSDELLDSVHKVLTAIY